MRWNRPARGSFFRASAGRDLAAGAARGLTLAAVLALSMSSVGCMGFRGGELDDARPWPPAPQAGAEKPAVRLTLVGKATLNRKPQQIPPAMVEEWLREAGKTYAASNLFRDVQAGPGPSDLRAEIEVLDAGSGSPFLWVMTGLTLGVIPSSATDEFSWKTTFKDGAGNIRGTIQKKASATMWMEILLVFGMPFSTPGAAVKTAIADLNRSTLQDAIEKGYLRP
jgi:hypothetical protein